MPPGELIYLNLPLHPGSKRDHEPPTAPGGSVKHAAENMGYPGVEVQWIPGTDNNWISCYQIIRNGQVIDTVAKGAYLLRPFGGCRHGGSLSGPRSRWIGQSLSSGRGQRADRAAVNGLRRS